MKFFSRWQHRRSQRTLHPPPRRHLDILLDEERYLGCGWFDSSHELQRGLRVTDIALEGGTDSAFKPSPGIQRLNAHPMTIGA